MSDDEERTDIVVNSIEDETPPSIIEKKKKTRKMTPETLEKLKRARELGNQKRKEIAEAKKKVKEIKEYKIEEIKSEPERYEKIKEKVKQDLSVDKWSNIERTLENMNLRLNKFDDYVEEKRKHRAQKTTRETLRELPSVVSENLLKEQLRNYELEQFRKRVFGM